MSELTRKEKAKAMRNGKMKMAKEGCVWTEEDDLLLQDMFEDGDDVLDGYGTHAGTEGTSRPATY